MAEPTETTDTLTDIHDAVGGLVDVFTEDPALNDDAALDAELDQKQAGDAADDAPAADPALATDAKPDAQADGAAAKKEDEPDPLANAQPFTYTVDKEARPFEGIRVLADANGAVQGAIVDPTAIGKLQDRLQRADFLESQDKQRWEKMREYEGITFKGNDGVEHKGLAAVEQYATENAKLAAAVKVLAETIETPEKLIALAYAVQNNDTTELQRLTREIGLVAKEATWEARVSWGLAQRQTAERATQEQDRTTITTQAIDGAVQHWAQQFPALTKDDVTKAIAHFSRVGSSIVRQATPDEAKAAGVKPGELIVDHPVLYEWLKDRAELRAQQADATQKAQAAAKENEKRLAAAANGQKGKTTRKPATPAKATVPADEGETWSQQRARLQNGQFAASDDE